MTRAGLPELLPPLVLLVLGDTVWVAVAESELLPSGDEDSEPLLSGVGVVEPLPSGDAEREGNAEDEGLPPLAGEALDDTLDEREAELERVRDDDCELGGAGHCAALSNCDHTQSGGLFDAHLAEPQGPPNDPLWQLPGPPPAGVHQPHGGLQQGERFDPKFTQSAQSEKAEQSSAGVPGQYDQYHAQVAQFDGGVNP